MKMFSLSAAAVAITLIAPASLSHALQLDGADFAYDLTDNQGGSAANKFDYGLRLDAISKFFSFESTSGDSLAWLEIDEDDNEALLYGQIRDNDDDSLWDIEYSWSDINIIGEGLFDVFDHNSDVGSGSITNGAEFFALSGKGRESDGKVFRLGQNVRGEPGGTGWVMIDGVEMVGANDFLFGMKPKDIGDDGGVGGEIPVPAPLALLLTSLAGLGFLGKRRQA